MANSYYQVATTPKLYVSYPLFQYANGALDEYSSVVGGGATYLSDKDIMQLIQIDPSKQVDLSQATTYGQIQLKIVPSFDEDTLVLDSGLWNFDYVMLLGHNFNTQKLDTAAYAVHSENTAISLSTSNIVNTTGENTPEYDGWSLMSLDDTAPYNNSREFRLGISINTGGTFDGAKLGSLLYGKSYSFPQNCQMNTSTVFEYGVKQKSTISGKTISTANWTKPNNWGTEPFGLTNGEEGDNFQRRTGRRVWKMTFDSLAPDKVFPQNMMINDNNYTPQDNHTQGAAENSSLYNINNSEDFYSSVVHKTLGGHLPMVLQLDQNDTSPSNFAIVRMNKDFKVQQKSPLLYTYSITLTEQI